MAITFSKQPLRYFNVNEPAIFEFTSDEDLGVNPNDLVADLELKSLWSGRRYVIKNILPNYRTGVFRVDVSGYLKSLQLDNFEYRYESTNKRLTVERYSIGISVHSENAIDVYGDAYVFDSGYIFDETFIFADEVPNDTEINTDFYPVIGKTYIAENPKPTKNPALLNILSPAYVEFAVGFDNTLNVLIGDNTSGVKYVVVDGVQSNIPNTQGVSQTFITENQINKMYLPTLIGLSTLNNPDIRVYGISYKASECEETLQFRFYNSYGGYSYFYTPKEERRGDRGKTDYINNAFYNQQENRSEQVQRDVTYGETLNLTGVKRIELEELYRELLRSPKIEVLMPKGFVECEVRGSFNERPLDFEYTLVVTISNVNQMSL